MKEKGHRTIVKKIILEDTKKMSWCVSSWKAWRDAEKKETAKMKREIKTLLRKVAKLEGKKVGNR